MGMHVYIALYHMRGFARVIRSVVVRVFTRVCYIRDVFVRMMARVGNFVISVF